MSTLTSPVTLDVTGMTCGHCVRAVTGELTELPGVTGVDVDLHAGGTTPVTVTLAGDVTEDALRAAVGEAGYDVVGVRATAGAPGATAEVEAAAPTGRQAAAAPVGRTAFSLTATPTTPREERPEGQSGHGCACGCS